MKRKGVGVQTIVVMGIMLIMAAVIVPSLGGLQNQLEQTGDQGSSNLDDAGDIRDDIGGDSDDGSDGSDGSDSASSSVLTAHWTDHGTWYGAPPTIRIGTDNTGGGYATFKGEYTGDDASGVSGVMSSKLFVKKLDGSWKRVSKYGGNCYTNDEGDRVCVCGMDEPPHTCGQVGTSGDYNLKVNSETPLHVKDLPSSDGKGVFVISKGRISIVQGELSGEKTDTPINESRVTNVPQNWLSGTVCGTRCVNLQAACASTGRIPIRRCERMRNSHFPQQNVHGTRCSAMSWQYGACAISAPDLSSDVNNLISGCSEGDIISACPEDISQFETFLKKNMTPYSSSTSISFSFPSSASVSADQKWAQLCKYNADFYPIDAGEVGSDTLMKCIGWIGRECVNGERMGTMDFSSNMCKTAMQSFCSNFGLSAKPKDEFAEGVDTSDVTWGACSPGSDNIAIGAAASWGDTGIEVSAGSSFTLGSNGGCARTEVIPEDRWFAADGNFDVSYEVPSSGRSGGGININERTWTDVGPGEIKATSIEDNAATIDTRCP